MVGCLEEVATNKAIWSYFFKQPTIHVLTYMYLSVRLPEVTLLYLMAEPPSDSTWPFDCVSLTGTVSHLNCAFYHEICPVPSTSSSRLFFSPGPGLSALMSYLEVALGR